MFLICFIYEYVVFWPSTRPKMPFKVMHQKEVTHSNGSYERKSRRWDRLIIWDKVKVPLQSDAPEESYLWTAWQLFPLDDDQTYHSKDWVGDWVGVELLYNSVKTRSHTVGVIETRSGREKPRQAEGPLGAPDELGSREVAVEHPWRTRKTQRWVGVNILQFCSVSNSLSQ